jgi:hypothetical protein
VLGAGLLGVVVGACLDSPKYVCSDDVVCVLNNVQGHCDLGLNTCVYYSPACMSQYRDGHGNCVTTTMPISTGVDSTSDASTSDEVGSSSSGLLSAGSSFGTTFGIDCDGQETNITNEGDGMSLSTASGFTEAMALDGIESTSWFSAPVGGGLPAEFVWATAGEHCVTRIEIDGNGMHANPDWREDTGFGSVRVRVISIDSEVVFEETHQLGGTPDPSKIIATDDAVGNRVVLQFFDPESPLGGGFSELRVFGQ